MLFKRMFGALFAFLFAFAVLPVAAPALAQDARAVQTSGDATESDAGFVYRLGSGDKVRITVYNEETMSGEYEVDGSGNLSLQLIGSVEAAGLSVPEVTAEIERRLRDGYLVNPSVAIEVLNYRPFYVLGEVREPGKYPYVSGMTVLNAIALAGGYTYRGKRDYALLMRASEGQQEEQRVSPTEVVMPGDIVRVPERFF